IPEKLQMKSGRTVLFVNKPAGYDKLMGKLPKDVMVADGSEKADVIQLFVESRSRLESDLPKVKRRLNAGGMSWMTYPKLTSQKKADINRDTIAEFAAGIGLEGVAICAIDEDWSALRLKVVG